MKSGGNRFRSKSRAAFAASLASTNLGIRHTRFRNRISTSAPGPLSIGQAGLGAVAPCAKLRHGRSRPSRDENGGRRWHRQGCPKAAGEGESRAQSGRDAPLRLDDFLPYQLNVAASLVSQALSKIYAERYGISVAEWRVLVTLGEFESMTGKAVGEHSHMHKTKVSRAVALLEKRKWLVRRVNRSDLRESFLSLTPEGRAIYDELAPGAVAFARDIVEAVDPADRPAFARALQQVIRRSKPLAGEMMDEFSDS